MCRWGDGEKVLGELALHFLCLGFCYARCMFKKLGSGKRNGGAVCVAWSSVISLLFVFTNSDLSMYLFDKRRPSWRLTNSRAAARLFTGH